MLRVLISAALTISGTHAWADSSLDQRVWLQDNDGARIEIAQITGHRDAYRVDMKDDAFSDHFLSMRPFKCLDGAQKTWCHVPYPYANDRDISTEATDLEYDFLFVWKGRTEYGIDMWNGVYYVLTPTDQGFLGHLHEVNMDILAVPPEDGNMRPIRAVDLEEAEPESHWLPTLIIE